MNYSTEEQFIISKRRSFGVGLIARVEIFAGSVFFCLSALCTFSTLLNPALPALTGYSRASELFAIQVGIISAIVGGITWLTGQFTFQLRPAGRLMNILFSIVTVCMYAVCIYCARPLEWWDMLLFIHPGISTALVFFFTRREVIRQFVPEETLI